MLISRFSFLEKKGQMEGMSIAERRDSSSEFLIAHITKTLLGKQALPSLLRCRISLKMAKNGVIPIPPATKTRFSYLHSETNLS